MDSNETQGYSMRDNPRTPKSLVGIGPEAQNHRSYLAALNIQKANQDFKFALQETLPNLAESYGQAKEVDIVTGEGVPKPILKLRELDQEKYQMYATFFKELLAQFPILKQFAVGDLQQKVPEYAKQTVGAFTRPTEVNPTAEVLLSVNNEALQNLAINRPTRPIRTLQISG